MNQLQIFIITINILRSCFIYIVHISDLFCQPSPDTRLSEFVLPTRPCNLCSSNIFLLQNKIREPWIYKYYSLKTTGKEENLVIAPIVLAGQSLLNWPKQMQVSMFIFYFSLKFTVQVLFHAGHFHAERAEHPQGWWLTTRTKYSPGPKEMWPWGFTVASGLIHIYSGTS